MRLTARRAWLAMLTVLALLGPITVAPPAVAAEVTNIIHVSLTAPASVVVGTTFQMTLVARNDGPGIWGNTSGGSVRGYTLNNTTGSAFFAQCSTGFINFNTSITCGLPSQIRAGQTARVVFTLRATRIGLVSLESSADKDDVDTDTNTVNNIGRTSTNVVADPRPFTPLSTPATGNPATYWTPQRMRDAEPLDETQTTSAAAQANAPAPGDIPAPKPDGPPEKIQPAAPAGETPARTAAIAPAAAPNPWPGRPVDAPARTVGRLFFTTTGLLASGAWCTATVVNGESKDVVLTAAHCLHGGSTPGLPKGTWHTNFMFVPGHSDPFATPPFGRWYPRQVWTTNRWTDQSRPTSRPWDFGALVMNPDASGRHIADVTGAQGIAFNQPYDQEFLALGYGLTSQDENGDKLKYCLGPGFLEVLVTLSDVLMQCDMAYGSSGGPRLSGYNWTTSTGFVNSVNAWSLPLTGNQNGPYFGSDVAALFNRVRNERLPLKAISGDWNGDGIDTPGFIRGNTWYLRNSNSGPGPADVVFSWGLGTDQPIVGDWDGNGKDGIGVKRGNQWYLANNPGAGTSQTFAWGLPTDKPVAGDWDGNGRDGIGVYRNGAWYLANVPGGGTSMQFNWGATTDTPITGDWDANGKDLVGVRRGNTYILSNTPGVTASSYAYGLATDQPITGDWNNDKRTTYGVVRLNQWYLVNTLNGATALSFPFG
jgi:hypothetical protein